MTSSYSVNRKMPLDALPAEQRELTEKALESQDSRERADLERRAAKAEAVKEETRRKLHDLLGSGNRAALRDAIRAEKRTVRDLMEPPQGLELDAVKVHRTRRRRVDSLVKKLGVDPKQLIDIGNSSLDALEEALRPAGKKASPGFNLAQNLSEWQSLTPHHKLPLDWGVRPQPGPVGSSDWQILGPPFRSGTASYNRVESDGFVVRHDYTLLEYHGAVGNRSTMDCNDGDDFDFAHNIVDTEVIFVFQAPAGGRLEVVVGAINLFGWHELRVEDEFGWSGQWTDQTNYLSLMVYHPNVTERSLSAMSNYNKRSGGDDFTYSRRALTPGTHYYGHMVSNGSVKQGDTFFVGVGTRTFDICGVNDVELHSRTDFQWWIRTIEIRMVK